MCGRTSVDTRRGYACIERLIREKERKSGGRGERGEERRREKKKQRKMKKYKAWYSISGRKKKKGRKEKKNDTCRDAPIVLYPIAGPVYK